jgi:S-adenosyl-L-methionine hydrolase (adenosine-forming)
MRIAEDSWNGSRQRLVAAFASCFHRPRSMLPRPTGLVTLLTDFGHADPYVGILTGALLRGSTKIQTVDISHAIPPQDVAAAAFTAWTLIDRFPAGTVHLAVVDPGVGTARRLLCVAAHECYWLAPDNGLLAPILRTDAAIDVRALDLEHLGIVPASRTFHGRDVLAPVAAWLAGGRYGFSALGPRVQDPVTTADPFVGPLRVVHIDHYGNLITNVTAAMFATANSLAIGGRTVMRRLTYGEVAPGDLLAYVGSFGLVEIAQRDGHAARLLRSERGAAVAVPSA